MRAGLIIWLAATVAGCTPPPTQELALGDMVPRGDAAAEVPAYTVYFEVGSAALSTEAVTILARMISDSARGGWTRVALAGHADRTGAARLNRRLAAARVEAVRKHLLAAGIPASLITTSVVGDRQAQAGAEAEDRRVEIFVTV